MIGSPEDVIVVWLRWKANRAFPRTASVYRKIADSIDAREHLTFSEKTADAQPSALVAQMLSENNRCLARARSQQGENGNG